MTAATSAPAWRPRRHLTQRFAPFVALLVLIGARLGEIHRFVSSDSLYSADLGRDMLDGRLRGWIFAPAPSFFPDGAISAALHLIRPSTDFVYLVYPFVTGALLYVLARYVIGILHPRQSAATQRWCAFAGVAGVVCPTVTWGTTPFQPLFPMILGPNYHGGIVLTGLAVILLTHRALVHRRWSFPTASAAWLVTFASTLSDKVMIPQGTVPALLLSAWILVQRPAQRAGSMLWAGVLGSSTIAALTTERYFADFGVGIGGVGQPSFQLSGLVDVLNHLPRLAIAYPAWGVSLLIGGGALVRAATMRQLSLRPSMLDDAGLLRWTLSTMAVLSAFTCALFAFTDVGEFRRMLPAFAIPIVLAPASLTTMIAGHRSSVAKDRTKTPARPVGAFTAAVVITLASAASMLAAPAGAFDFSLAQPTLARCVDRLRSQGILDAGLSDYWNSRLVNLTGTKGTTNVALWTDGAIFGSSLNLRSSLGRDTTHRPGGLLNMNYIVPQGLDRPSILQRYGKPSRTLQCADQEIWVYSDGALGPQVKDLQRQAAYRLTLG